MKQYITIEQQNELSDKAHMSLVEWCNKNISSEEAVWGQHGGECRGGANLHEYLLTIGQMIEFLDEKSEVGTLKILFDRYLDQIDELCDALWEAVKQALGEESK